MNEIPKEDIERINEESIVFVKKNSLYGKGSAPIGSRARSCFESELESYRAGVKAEYLRQRKEFERQGGNRRQP